VTTDFGTTQELNSLYFGLAPLLLRMYSACTPAQLRLSYGAATLLTRKTSQD